MYTPPPGFSLPRNYAQNTKTLCISGVLQASLPDCPVDDDGNAYEAGQAELILTFTQCRPQARAMVVVGHSMDDGSNKAIRHGDIVLVDPNILFSQYHNTANTVLSTQNGYIVKQRGLVRGRHLLVSRNPNYPPVKFDPDWQMIGIVYAVYLGPKEVRWL